VLTRLSKSIALLLGVSVSSLCLAVSPTGEVLLKDLNMPEAEIRSLESGEVVTRLASEYEQSKREMAIDATIVINKPLDVLLEQAEDQITLVPDKIILASAEITSEADFAAVGFTAGEADEAARVLNAKRNDALNLGEKDLAIIKKVKGQRNGRSNLDLASEAIRQVLTGRYRDYMARGLKGVEPYVRKRDSVSAGQELKLSNEQLLAVDKYYPDYFDTLVNFPRSAECCEHRFMWMKAKVRSRPTFILIHRILLSSPEAVILTERHFYVSHTLNSLQLTLGWLPYGEHGDDTYLGIATSANSDYLTGFVGKLIRSFGANKGAKMMGGILVDIREELEAGRPVSANHED
jgi:hypothetical protein